MTGLITVPPGMAAYVLDLESARGSVHSRHAGVKAPTKTIVHVRNGLVAHTSFHPVPERCKFANFRKLNGFGQTFNVLKTFSQSVSRCQLFTVCTKAFVSCEFTPFRIFLFILIGCRLVKKVFSFPCGVQPNSSHQLETAPYTLS